LKRDTKQHYAVYRVGCTTRNTKSCWPTPEERRMVMGFKWLFESL